MRFLFLLFLSFGVIAHAQVDINQVLERDIFDPMRGKEPVEEKEEKPEAVPEVKAKDEPILDGVLIVGNTRIAMFTVLLEGTPTPVRTKVNETITGTNYRITGIERNQVSIAGRTEPFKLFSGIKKNRGGTKKAVKRGGDAKKNSNVRKDKNGVPLPERKKPTRELPKTGKNNKNNRKDFQRRKPPTRDKNSRTEQIKKKF